MIFEINRISYEDDSFTAKLQCRLETADTQEIKAFKRSIYGIKYPEMINQKFMLNNKEFEFIGFKANARKNNALIKNSRGKIFRIPFLGIKRELLKSIGKYEELI